MTRDDILAKVKRGELSVQEASVLLDKLEKIRPAETRLPPKFKVAEKSGWLSVYFDRMWRPCSLPSNIWLELLDNGGRLRAFIEENKDKFTNK